MIHVEEIQKNLAGLYARRHEAAQALECLTGGREPTPLFLAIEKVGEDVYALIEEVQRLSSQASDATLRNALIGILRADGYRVNPPDASDDYTADSPRCGTLTGATPLPSKPLDDWTRSPTGVSLEIGGDPTEHGPDVCPKCETPLPSSGAPCRYADCNKPDSVEKQPALPLGEPALAAPPPLATGSNVRIVDGLWAGRFATLGDIDLDGVWSCRLVAKGVELVGAKDIPAAQVAIENPHIDDTTAAESPVAKAGRAPENKLPVSGWSPSDKDITEMAGLTGHSTDRVRELVAEFKALKKDAPAQSRWRVPFVAWAKTQPAQKMQTEVS